jgi:hypothetical protein
MGKIFFLSLHKLNEWNYFFQALSSTILLQDGPFLCLRLGLIIHYKIISQSNVFFTTKNLLVVLLQLYRVYVIIIEHRKRNQLAHSSDTIQTSNGLPDVPQKSTTGRKKRTATISTASDGSLAIQSTSMTNLRSVKFNDNHINSDGNSDPLPRRKHLSASILVPPRLPPSRPIISHSKSLTTVQQPNISLTNQKICTEV